MRIATVPSAAIRKGENKLKVTQNELNIDQGDSLYDYIESIEKRARYAAKEMYDIIKYEHSDNIKIANWCQTAIKCVEHNPMTSHVPDNKPLLYAQYGYAVEEYVNIEIRSGNLPPPRGYKISLQETHGSTRPDFVIKRKIGAARDETLAWLDLTSENSSGHINQKSGIGWQKAPFVAELFYPPLKLDKIGIVGRHSIGKRAHLNSAIRRQTVQQRGLNRHMVCCTNKALARLSSQKTISRPQIAEAFEREFHYPLKNIKNRQQIVRGILKKYIADSQSNYPTKANYIISEFYSEIRTRETDSMQYVRDSYAANNLYITGEEPGRYF